MGDNKVKTQEEVPNWMWGVIGLGVAVVAADLYLDRKRVRKDVDEFVRKQCRGVDEQAYKGLFDDLWKNGIYDSIGPLQFYPNAVEELRRKCQQARGIPSTAPIPELKPREPTWVIPPLREITETESLLDKVGNWVEVHATGLQAGSLAIAALATIGVIVLSVGSGGFIPAFAGAALMLQDSASK